MVMFGPSHETRQSWTRGHDGPDRIACPKGANTSEQRQVVKKTQIWGGNLKNNKNAGLRPGKYNKKPQLEQLNKDVLFAGPLSV